jgi:hypothetical protein
MRMVPVDMPIPDIMLVALYLKLSPHCIVHDFELQSLYF